MRKEEEVKKKGGKRNNNKVGGMFMAALVIWGASVVFEIAGHNKRRDLLAVVASFIFFQAANVLIRLFVSREPLFVNTCVSLLHSSLTSSFVVFILVNQWRAKGWLQMLEHQEVVHNTWSWAYTALCLSCGYFGYDQCDMLKYRLYTTSGGCFPSVLAHHFVLLICFTLALYRNLTINYLILTLICELHSVFLHVRKIRRMAGIRNAESSIVKLEWLLNCFTFIFARAIPHALILIKLVRDASKFDKGIQLPLACFGMIAMNALNIGLAIDLVAAYNRDNTPRNYHTD